MLKFIGFTGEKNSSGHKLAKFMCDCGKTQTFSASRVKNGYAHMCRKCQSKRSKILATKHGMKGTREYRIWTGMKSRCHNPNSKDYARYGGSGITVCKDWRNNFESFFKHMGKCPSSNHSIDRIDNKKGYEPGNVRWADSLQQGRNKRNATYVTDGEKVYRINEVASMMGITRGAAHLRLKRGKLHGFTAHTPMDK